MPGHSAAGVPPRLCLVCFFGRLGGRGSGSPAVADVPVWGGGGGVEAILLLPWKLRDANGAEGRQKQKALLLSSGHSIYKVTRNI